ncbi:hypothetical protein ACFCV8_06945 [Streptomyces sp. NPDC056347]|uniref:hypothetical protein n=1 Tax=Streptomyces sp. NPDC056347 TaxID=3345790 RepID=UPI0035D9BB9A
MTEPRRYADTQPLRLPLSTRPAEPEPAQGCAGCAELAKVRSWARAGFDLTTVTDCNVLMRRHPEGH